MAGIHTAHYVVVKRGCRGRREHSVNVALDATEYLFKECKTQYYLLLKRKHFFCKFLMDCKLPRSWYFLINVLFEGYTVMVDGHESF